MREAIDLPICDVRVVCIVCEGLGVICKPIHPNDLCRHCEGSGRIIKGDVDNELQD